MKKEKQMQLMNCRELAEYLRFSPGTIRNWTYRGFIPHIKVGRSVLYCREDIDSWLEKQKRREGDQR